MNRERIMCISSVVFIFGTFLNANGICEEDTTEAAFTTIYEQALWGTNAEGIGFSGCGSFIENARPYIEVLEKYLSFYNIRSVVDLGCGDWEFSKIINWEDVEYIGYDVVKSVIDRNRANYEAPNIRFLHENGILADLPPADLLICKDVLMHLPYKDIFMFLNQLSKFEYCLITNDVAEDNGGDINRGNFRPVDLMKAPFFLKATKVLTYRDITNGAIKDVLFLVKE